MNIAFREQVSFGQVFHDALWHLRSEINSEWPFLLSNLTTVLRGLDCPRDINAKNFSETWSDFCYFCQVEWKRGNGPIECAIAWTNQAPEGNADQLLSSAIKLCDFATMLGVERYFKRLEMEFTPDD